MFDPYPHFGPKRKKLLEHSWAKVFRDELLTLRSLSPLIVRSSLGKQFAWPEETNSEHGRKTGVKGLRVRSYTDNEKRYHLWMDKLIDKCDYSLKKGGFGIGCIFRH